MYILLLYKAFKIQGQIVSCGMQLAYMQYSPCQLVAEFRTNLQYKLGRENASICVKEMKATFF